MARGGGCVGGNREKSRGRDGRERNREGEMGRERERVGGSRKESREGGGRGAPPHHSSVHNNLTRRTLNTSDKLKWNKHAAQTHIHNTHSTIVFLSIWVDATKIFGVNRCFVSALRNLLKNVISFGDDGQRSIWCHVIYTYIHQGNWQRGVALFHVFLVPHLVYLLLTPYTYRLTI